jgi:hypothetical protein
MPVRIGEKSYGVKPFGEVRWWVKDGDRQRTVRSVRAGIVTAGGLPSSPTGSMRLAVQDNGFRITDFLRRFQPIHAQGVRKK